MSIFTKAELENLRLVDAEIEAQTFSGREELKLSRSIDRILFPEKAAMYAWRKKRMEDPVFRAAERERTRVWQNANKDSYNARRRAKYAAAKASAEPV